MAIPVKSTGTVEQKNTKRLQRIQEAKQIAYDELTKAKQGSYEMTFCLSSKVLSLMPRGSMNTLQDIALSITDYIQKKLADSDQSALIAKLKDDPTNADYRTDAFIAINKEFLSYTADNNKHIINLSSFDKIEQAWILAMVVNEICGLGPLEPLYRDATVQELIANGPKDIQIDRGGIPERVPGCEFQSVEHLESLLSKLFASINREISRTNPRENSRLKDNSRIHATHVSIAPSGPNLNIRKHPKDWTDPFKLISLGAMNEEMAEWLGNMVYHGCSIMVNGGTSTGKTTLLSALIGFLPNNRRLVSIEKNLELKFPRNKMMAAPMETIPRKNNSGNFEVTIRDLVAASTQMRPDTIIVGELIDDAAYDFLQAGNTGHQVMASEHSNSSADCMERTMSLCSQSDLIKGKQAYDLIAAALDIVVTLKRYPQDGSRKIVDISEVGRRCVDGPNGPYLPVRTIWTFIPENDKGKLGEKVVGRWEKVGELSTERQENHNLNLVKHLSLQELREVCFQEVED